MTEREWKWEGGKVLFISSQLLSPCLGAASNLHGGEEGGLGVRVRRPGARVNEEEEETEDGNCNLESLFRLFFYISNGVLYRARSY